MPLTGGGCLVTEQFVVGDGLGVKIRSEAVSALLVTGLCEHTPDLSLGRAGWADDEDRVTDIEKFLELDDLQDEVLFRKELGLLSDLADGLLEGAVDFTSDLDLGEQIP